MHEQVPGRIAIFEHKFLSFAYHVEICMKVLRVWSTGTLAKEILMTFYVTDWHKMTKASRNNVLDRYNLDLHT